MTEEICQCKMCKKRKVPSVKPYLKPCECGNTKIILNSWTITPEFYAGCPICQKFTKEYYSTKSKHGAIRAAEAWNKDKVKVYLDEL